MLYRDARPARLIMKTPAKGFIVKPRRGDPITAGGERSVTPGSGSPINQSPHGTTERIKKNHRYFYCEDGVFLSVVTFGT